MYTPGTHLVIPRTNVLSLMLADEDISQNKCTSHPGLSMYKKNNIHKYIVQTEPKYFTDQPLQPLVPLSYSSFNGSLTYQMVSIQSPCR